MSHNCNRWLPTGPGSLRRVLTCPPSDPDGWLLDARDVGDRVAAAGQAQEPPGIRDSVPPGAAQQWRLFGRIRMG